MVDFVHKIFLNKNHWFENKANYKITPRLDLIIALVFLLIFTFQNFGFGQTFKAQVVDKTSQRGLSYAHIGILNSSIGTVSDEEGYFELNFTEAQLSDSICISFLGYQSFALAVGETDKFYTIELPKESLTFEEVVIKDQWSRGKFKKTKKLGRKRGRSNYSGSSSIGWGGEIGIIIRGKRKLNRIKDVNFKIMPIQCDSILFRINVYQMDHGVPTNSLLHSQIFVTGKRGNDWIKKDVEDQDIFFRQNILVSLESVKAWSRNGQACGVFYSNGGLYNSPTFSKVSSMAGWEKVDHPKLTLYLNIDQYKQ